MVVGPASVVGATVVVVVGVVGAVVVAAVVVVVVVVAVVVVDVVVADVGATAPEYFMHFEPVKGFTAPHVKPLAP